MQIEIHDRIPEDTSLQQEWNALAANMERPQVFYTWEWARAMASAYASANPVCLLLAREAGQLVGVAALTLRDGKRAEFLSGSTADYCDLLSTPHVRGEFLEAVLNELRVLGCQQWVLANLPNDSATAGMFSARARRHGFHSFTRHAYDCVQVKLGSRGERQQLRATLTGKKWFRYGMRAMGRNGAVSLEHLTTWNQVEPMLPAFARAHIGRFLATHRISNLVSSSRREFQHELARLLCAQGWLCLSRLEQGERAIAWNFGFQYGPSWFWYQPTFDGNFEQYSPGNILLASIIAEACEQEGIQLVDLGLGAEDYKNRFANATRETVHVTASRSIARTFAVSVRYGASTVVKKSPWLESAVRKEISRFKSTREAWNQRVSAKSECQTPDSTFQKLDGSGTLDFYNWPAERASRRAPFRLERLNLDLLSRAAICFEGDRSAEEYLLKAAENLREANWQGYALCDREDQLLHFCWSAPFDGFYLPSLHLRLTASVTSAALIFDCWTPAAYRRRGYYTHAIAMVADQLVQTGQAPWIFSAASHSAAVRGIADAGFSFAYSLNSRGRQVGRNGASNSRLPQAELKETVRS